MLSVTLIFSAFRVTPILEWYSKGFFFYFFFLFGPPPPPFFFFFFFFSFFFFFLLLLGTSWVRAVTAHTHQHTVDSRILEAQATL